MLSSCAAASDFRNQFRRACVEGWNENILPGSRHGESRTPSVPTGRQVSNGRRKIQVKAAKNDEIRWGAVETCSTYDKVSHGCHLRIVCLLQPAAAVAAGLQLLVDVIETLPQPRLRHCRRRRLVVTAVRGQIVLVFFRDGGNPGGAPRRHRRTASFRHSSLSRCADFVPWSAAAVVTRNYIWPGSGN